jgi:hypothetical protein
MREGQVLDSKFEYEGGRVDERFIKGSITTTAGTTVGQLVVLGNLGDDGGCTRPKSSVCSRWCRSRARHGRLPGVLRSRRKTVHDTFRLPSHGLVSWWRDEKHDLPLGMDDRHGGPRLHALITHPHQITAICADVVVRGLSVV